MSLSTADKVFLVVSLIDFGGMIACIGVALHLAYTRMDELLEHLKNCSAIMIRAPLRHGGPWGKLLLVGGISGIVTFPNFYLKRGQLNPEELRDFPAQLKRTLARLQWSLISFLLLMLVLWVVVELELV
ncbi:MULTISPECIES: hypothetical protein [unclassified Pseudomonas]|uniref:hypothetical protein n=1 Tax=unclassified Pseudomonas TaxID=196821 RepID=UPI00069F6C5B|nr:MULTISPECIES: hypothetical protein [unclassified Pseudomonas]WPN46788.1 hypothetical protein QMK58_27180 [Pseudomonas sp. P8_241]